MQQYGLIKTSAGTNGYDAIHPDGKTVQVKTNHASSEIGFRGEADLMLVIHVDLTGECEFISPRFRTRPYCGCRTGWDMALRLHCNSRFLPRPPYGFSVAHGR